MSKTALIVNVYNSMDAMASSTDQARSKLSLAAPSTKTVSVQTDYRYIGTHHVTITCVLTVVFNPRDGEAQTDPYSPEYIVRPGSQPEVLTIATMCYGEQCVYGVLLCEHGSSYR